jgi:hypothetical protein
VTSYISRLSYLSLVTGLLVLFGTATPASATDFRSDPRVTAAVAAWKTSPLYVDPLYAGSKGFSAEQVQQAVGRIATAPVPVFVAVLPTGSWFPEKKDAPLLAGWLAATNGKPGIYLVMDGYATIGVDHLVKVRTPGWTYKDSPYSTVAEQVGAFLDAVEPSERADDEPARTAALPEQPEPTYEPERYTAGEAIGTGLAGFTLGLMGGAILALPVLGLAALVAGRRGGRL